MFVDHFELHCSCRVKRYTLRWCLFFYLILNITFFELNAE